MAKEYIELDEALNVVSDVMSDVKVLHKHRALNRNLKQLSTTNVVGAKRGEWQLKSQTHKMFDDVDEEFYVECPFCHRTEYVPFEFEKEKMLEYARENYPYCHCGAKMTENN